MSQRPRVAPIPADFFFADPIRSTMSPVLVAAMTLAYQYSELIRSEGFLTEPQLVTSLGQLSAHGCDVASVIRELLALRQLDDVGTGYQLPLLHTFLRRRAHAVQEQRRYHEAGGRIRKSRGGTKSRSKDRHAVGDADAPVSQYRNRMSVPPPFMDETKGAQDGSKSAPNSCSDPGPTSDSSSASASFRSDPSTRPEPTSAEGRSRSGLSFESQNGNPQSRTHTSGGNAPQDDRRRRGSRRDEAVTLSPESQEVLDELLDQIDNPVTRLEPGDRGQPCSRKDYGPPAHLLAEWVDRLPMDQIKKDLDRYREKGEGDVTAVKEHDRRFVCFMKSSLGYKFRNLDIRMAAERAMIQCKKRQRDKARQQEERQRLAREQSQNDPRVYAQLLDDDRPEAVKRYEEETRQRREEYERRIKEAERLARMFEAERDARERAAQSETAHV